ncbi:MULTISPECIES: hypothetical protein [unclassified Streptomyces]|uniref:hypothetical protein n=1 Tax=unclassified Streptomyces TaxID=2593676 RepID=UPI00380E0534
MRAIRATATTLLSVAALALISPTAAAAVDGGAQSFGFTVTPTTAAPGGRVTLAVTNCATTATASSGVFDTVSIPSNGSAVATVDWDARAGALYTVTFTCGTTTGRTPLTIAGTSVTPPVTSPIAPGGVRGGLGGSVGGVTTGELAAGTALVVAAATGSVYAARRRAEHRPR